MGEKTTGRNAGSSFMGQPTQGGIAGLNNTSASVKPVPMKLFSSWEVDRTPPNCIPRLCSLTLIRLVVMRPLPTSEVSSLLIAVKMAGSRRTLRSNEIQLSPNGLTDTELELHFSLQYPHFLKRDENKLLIMLQRRKKYKNRTILGYKTLAEGTIDMAVVLQRSLDMDLQLVAPEGSNKENTGPLARISVLGICSQPIDDLEGDRKSKQGKARVLGGHDFSDEEDDFSSHSSDSPPDDAVIIRKNSKSNPHNRNLKQKIVNLLKKFKATEECQRSSECKTGGPVADIDELFDELEGLSDSEPDADTLSVGSFPKPVLPPFFASSRSLAHHHNVIPERPMTSDENKGESDSWTEPDQHSGDSPNLNTRSPALAPVIISTNLQMSNGKGARPKLGSITEQCLILDEGFPDLVVFVSLDGPGPGIFASLADCGIKVLGIDTEADLRVALQVLVGKVQKFCNNNAKPPPPLTIVCAGNEALLSGITKTYVTQLSSKSHDWQSYFAFLYAPFSVGGSVWRLLSNTDSNYAQSFNDFTERGGPEEFAVRLISYVKVTAERRHVINLPIAEAMVTYKENEESSQVFVPFISECRLKVGYSLASMDAEGDLSSSPPSPPLLHAHEDPLELQVDYWKGTVKSSIKAFFRELTIQRTQDNGLSVTYVLKEQKKQKIMRLGKKKERDSDVKNLTLDGVSRLVCLAKSQIPIKLFVDGVAWPGVKFFQVSSQWQSQVKSLPLIVTSPQGKSKADTS